MMRKTVLLGALLTASLAVGVEPATASRHKPLRVRVALSSRAVTRTIGQKGGTLRVKTPDGAKVTLAIPRRALPQSTRITMTAVKSVRGLPFRHRLAGAVGLRPEGLGLMRAGTLTFSSKHRIAPSRRAAVAWRAAGRDAHLYPRSGGRALRMALTHFSGYGIGDASKAEQRDLAAHTPSDAQSRAENRLGELLDGRADLDSPAFQDALADALAPEYRHVADRMAAAESDDTIAEATLREAMWLDRQVQLLAGTGETFTWTPPHSRHAGTAQQLRTLAGRIRRSWPRVWANLYSSAKRRCVADNQPGQADRLMDIERQREMIGTDPVGFDTMVRDVYRCARYTLEASVSFTDDFQLHYPECRVPVPGYQDVAVEGSAVTREAEGTGTLTVDDATYDPGEADCGDGTSIGDMWDYTLGQTSPGTLAFRPTVHRSAGTGVSRPGATVTNVAVLPNVPAVQMLYDVGIGQLSTSQNLFTDAWRVAHRAEATRDADQRLWYTITGWQPGDGDVIGTRTSERDIAYADADEVGHISGAPGWSTTTGTLHETTTLTLRHTPDPSLASGR